MVENRVYRYLVSGATFIAFFLFLIYLDEAVSLARLMEMSGLDSEKGVAAVLGGGGIVFFMGGFVAYQVALLLNALRPNDYISEHFVIAWKDTKKLGLEQEPSSHHKKATRWKRAIRCVIRLLVWLRYPCVPPRPSHRIPVNELSLFTHYILAKEAPEVHKFLERRYSEVMAVIMSRMSLLLACGAYLLAFYRDDLVRFVLAPRQWLTQSCDGLVLGWKSPESTLPIVFFLIFYILALVVEVIISSRRGGTYNRIISFWVSR